MFRIELLPAQQGDAAWIEYGPPAAPHRILIDAGTPATGAVVRARIDQVPVEQRRLELLMVTHIDTDHIGGVLKLLAQRPAGLAFGDVWFNAWRHLQPRPSSKLGPIDGEILSSALDKLGWPWNAAFDGGPVVVPDQGAPPTKQLPGGMRLTLLSPGQTELDKLRSRWRSTIRAAGLDPKNPDRAATLLAKAARKGVASSILGPERPNVERLARSVFTPDTAVANGSTIAVLAEYEGHSCLLTGDGFPQVMLPALQRLLQARGARRLRLDVVKVPHHGSRYNLSNQLLETIRASQYLFSTSGAVFGHPNDEAVARIIWANRHHGCRLQFNYPKPDPASRAWPATKWDDSKLKRDYRYEVSFAGQGGTVLDLDQ